jgi:hypothetical protein
MPGVGTQPDASLVAECARDFRAASHAALDEAAHLSEVPRELEAVIGHGRTWDDALEAVERDDGDVLVVGSGPPPGCSWARRRRRSSGAPVPVTVVPRGVAAELRARGCARRVAGRRGATAAAAGPAPGAP